MAVVKKRQSGALVATLVRIELLAPVTLRLVPDGIGSRRAAIGNFLVRAGVLRCFRYFGHVSFPHPTGLPNHLGVRRNHVIASTRRCCR